MSALQIPHMHAPISLVPLSPAHMARNAALAERIAVFRGRMLPRAAWCRVYAYERTLARKPLAYHYAPQ